MDIKNMDNEELLRTLKVREWTAGTNDELADTKDLEAEILSRMLGWVSVDAALPEENVDVLVLDANYGTCEVARLYVDSVGTPRWFYAGDEYQCNGTHWMPLPQPPKDAK